MSKEKERVLLFSVTRHDLVWQTFRAGGPGGQHQQKNETGVRCTHPPSGAVGEARDNKSQYVNKQSAFVRMVNSNKFRVWHKMETARRKMEFVSIEEMIEKHLDKFMSLANIRIEVRDASGKWVEVTEEEFQKLSS